MHLPNFPDKVNEDNLSSSSSNLMVALFKLAAAFFCAASASFWDVFASENSDRRLSNVLSWSTKEDEDLDGVNMVLVELPEGQGRRQSQGKQENYSAKPKWKRYNNLAYSGVLNFVIK